MSQFGPSKISWWHEAILDWELCNPERSLTECARELNVTLPWLSTIRNCDAFKLYRDQRMKEHQERLSKTVIEKVEDVAELTLEVLHERIEKEREEISLKTVNETCALALKSLGFGGGNGHKTPEGPQLNVYIGANAEALESARSKMKLIGSSNSEELAQQQPHQAEELTEDDSQHQSSLEHAIVELPTTS